MDDPVVARRRGYDYWPALALFALAVFWPVAWLTWDWVTLTGYYEESLGFRYFYSLRIVHEPQRYLFLAQGHLVTLSHQMLQVLLDLVLPAVPLQPRIDAFARLAIALGHALATGALAWALRPALFDGLRIPIAALWALLYYVDGWDGYYVLLSPDYHTWIPVAGLLFSGLMARAIADGGSLPAARYLQLGALGAFAVGVKITLGALAAVASAYFLLTDRLSVRARRGFLYAVILGEILALLVFCAHYWGHVAHVRTYVLRFAYFLASAVPIDVMTAARLKGIVAGGSAFGLIAVALLPFTLLGLLAFARSRPDRVLAGVLGAGALIYGYLMVKRFTPVTIFEAGVFMAAALSLCAAIAAQRWPVTRFGAPAAVGLAIALGVAVPHTLSATIENLHANHAAQDRLRAALAPVPGTVAFLIPSNRYQFLSLEGALFKGTSDLETRGEVLASPLATRLLGNREFLFGEGARYQRSPPQVAAYGAVVFTVLYSGSPERDGVAGIPGRVAELERNYNVSLAAFACRDWIDFGGRLAVVCRRAAPAARV